MNFELWFCYCSYSRFFTPSDLIITKMADANELLEPPEFIFLVLSETNFNFVCIGTVFSQVLIGIQIFCVFIFLVALAWLNLVNKGIICFLIKKVTSANWLSWHCELLVSGENFPSWETPVTLKLGLIEKFQVKKMFIFYSSDWFRYLLMSSWVLSAIVNFLLLSPDLVS